MKFYFEMSRLEAMQLRSNIRRFTEGKISIR